MGLIPDQNSEAGWYFPMTGQALAHALACWTNLMAVLSSLPIPCIEAASGSSFKADCLDRTIAIRPMGRCVPVS